MRFDCVRLEIHDAPGDPVEMPIFGADPHDRYILKAADGLGPPEISVTMTDPLTGARKLQGRKQHGREIVMRIGLNPLYLLGESAADLRAELYQFVMPSTEATLFTEPTEVKISLIDEKDEVAHALGYMSKFEIVPFSRDPEVQLTFACKSPYWEGPAPVLKEFDPSAPSPLALDVKGNVPTGFGCRLRIMAATSSVKLIVLPYGNEFTVFHDFGALEELVIDTIPGQRKIELGNGQNLIGQLASTDDWVTIQNGSTELTVAGGGGEQVDFLQLSYPVLYWGV